MPNQTTKSENLIIAEKAGIATKFPGFSETKSRFVPYSKEDYANCIRLNKDLNRINRIRLDRYQSDESYKITGTSEIRSKYPNHFLANPNLINEINSLTDTTKQNNKNNKATEPYYNKKYIVGNTEYFDRYKKPGNIAESRTEAPLTINPSVDLTRGSYGRPYEQLNSNQLQAHYDTQYKTTHQWPVPENLSRFEWLNNH